MFNKLFNIDFSDNKVILRIIGIKISLKNPIIKTKNLYYNLINLIYEIKKTCKIIQTPIIINKNELVEQLITSNKSIARYGDGEFGLIYGGSNGFQQYDENLSVKLRNILISDNSNLCVCIPGTINSLKGYCKHSKRFWRVYKGQKIKKILNLLNLNKIYYDSFFSRPYIGQRKDNNTYSKTQLYFNKLKQIWKEKSIVFVKGYGSRLGVGNDLFKNAKSIKRILCPNLNAYEKYDEILKECQKQPKNTLFILALGMTATVLAADLCALGYKALDVGHIDIEYEWFLMKAQDKIEIENKNVNECGTPNITTDINDPEYQRQIIAKI